MTEPRRLLPLLAILCGGCGQTGDLYLPEPSGEVVTRPTQTPLPEEPGKAPNSPRTVDSPNAPASPAPEVAAPEATAPAEPDAEKKKEESKQPLPPPSPPTSKPQ